MIGHEDPTRYMYMYVVSGLEKMVDVYEAKPDFADAETMDSTRRKLSHVRCHSLKCSWTHSLTSIHFPLQINWLIYFFEATSHKLEVALATLDQRPKPSNELSNYIDRTKDKQVATKFPNTRRKTVVCMSSKWGHRECLQGHTISILKLPSSVVTSQQVPHTRPPGDGGYPESSYGKFTDSVVSCH